MQFESHHKLKFARSAVADWLLIGTHGVFCEVRTEGNVDLLVFRALLSLIGPALSQLPNNRPVTTIIKPRIVGVFDCSNPTNSSQKEEQLRSPPYKTAFKYLNKFRCFVRSLQLRSDINVGQLWHPVAFHTLLSGQWRL